MLLSDDHIEKLNQFIDHHINLEKVAKHLPNNATYKAISLGDNDDDFKKAIFAIIAHEKIVEIEEIETYEEELTIQVKKLIFERIQRKSSAPMRQNEHAAAVTQPSKRPRTPSSSDEGPPTKKSNTPTTPAEFRRLQGQITQLTAAQEGAKQKQIELEQQNQQLTEKATTVQQQLAALEQQLQTEKVLTHKLRQAQSDLQKKFEELNTSYECQQARQKELTEQLSQAKLQYETLEEQKKDSEKQFQKLVQELRSLQDQNSLERASLQKKIERLEATIKGLGEEKSSLEAAKTQLKQGYDKFLTEEAEEQGRLREDLTKERQRTQALDTKLQLTGVELAQLKSRLALLEKNATDRESSTQEKSQLAVALALAQSDLASKTDELAAQAKTIASLQQELEKSKTNQHLEQAELLKIKAQHAEELANLQQTAQEHQRNRMAVESQVLGLTSELNALKLRLAEAEKSAKNNIARERLELTVREKDQALRAAQGEIAALQSTFLSEVREQLRFFNDRVSPQLAKEQAERARFIAAAESNLNRLSQQPAAAIPAPRVAQSSLLTVPAPSRRSRNPVSQPEQSSQTWGAKQGMSPPQEVPVAPETSFPQGMASQPWAFQPAMSYQQWVPQQPENSHQAMTPQSRWSVQQRIETPPARSGPPGMPLPPGVPYPTQMAHESNNYKAWQNEQSDQDSSEEEIVNPDELTAGEGFADFGESSGPGFY